MLRNAGTAKASSLARGECGSKTSRCSLNQHTRGILLRHFSDNSFSLWDWVAGFIVTFTYHAHDGWAFIDKNHVGR